MHNLEEKTLKSTPLFQGKVISLQVDEVSLPNGEAATREIVKHPGAVAIIPFTENGKLVLIRQFRKAIEKEIFEIPAGKLEAGESPEVCANRELEEETGLKANKLELLASFYTSPGFANEKIYLFEASQLAEGQSNLDEDEFVEVVQVTLSEACQLIEQQQIHDAKTMYAIKHWQHKQAQERIKQLLGE